MRRIAFAALLVLTACGGETGDRSTLNYYFTSDPRSLDPALSTDVQTGETITLLFDNLTRFDIDANLEPGLAERWDLDSAGVVYTFHLRPDVTFHDGRRVVAADVKASFLRVLDPRATGGRNWPLMPIAGAREYAAGDAEDVRGIRVVDDSTVAIEITEPLNVFPKLLAMPVAAIVPTPTPANFDQQPVGSGPWRFVSWAHDDAIVLSANENYWGGRPAEDTLIIRIIPEPLTQAAEFEAGNLSVVEVPFGETRRWEQEKADLLQRRPAIRDLYIAINTTRGPLADVRVRRALNHAVDVETIIASLLGGNGIRLPNLFVPGGLGYDNDLAPHPYDPELAQQLLAEAGYPDGFSTRLAYTTGERADLAAAIAGQLGAAGIDVELEPVETATFNATWQDPESAPLRLLTWRPLYDPYTLLSLVISNTGFLSRYDNPEAQTLIEAGAIEPDLEERNRIYRELGTVLHDSPAGIYLWSLTSFYGLGRDAPPWTPRGDDWILPLVVENQS